MSKILITGATGNIGIEVIRYLNNIKTSNTIVAGVRNIENAKNTFKKYPKLEYVHFDFEKPETFENALDSIERIFLLRPPHISNIEKYFRPLIIKLKKKNVNEIIFLSVQGAEKSKLIPHHKIEILIKEFGLNYIFLRPSYFMQNLTTTLIGDIKSKREIILPAGKAKFNWIDIENIGEVGAQLLDKFSDFQNQAIEITGLENESFSTVVSLINKTISNPISYRNISPPRYYLTKKREGTGSELILVMILLHFLPRFQKGPRISNFYEKLTGKQPTSLKLFVNREKQKFEKQ